jgi:hypothetical protein
VEIRAGGNVYTMVTVVCCIFLVIIVAVFCEAIARKEFPVKAAYVVATAAAFPGLVVFVVRSLRVIVTGEEIRIWQADAFAHRMRIVDVGRAVEDRYGSSGTLYLMAPFHALLIYPKEGVEGREMVINLKPYRDEDIHRVFEALRERGVEVEEYGHRKSRRRRR